MELHGNNAVELQVHGSAFGCQYSCVYKLYAVVVLFSVLLISSVLLGFWRFRLNLKQGQGGEANQSGKNLECLSEQNESGCEQPEVKRGEETRLDSLQTTPNNKGQMDMSVH
ncbi:hypothetical protein AGOR_G00163750 [Albula goreensis]|uniref:Uncharacterized protein n=1 Tax=Albula goreensis TaxID=1534307 RepID=A0A8T3CW88_9TELE|nr:hypothetical protein AGOR_G00163750 [Albula goreensis]